MAIIVINLYMEEKDNMLLQGVKKGNYFMFRENFFFGKDIFKIIISEFDRFLEVIRIYNVVIKKRNKMEKLIIIL